MEEGWTTFQIEKELGIKRTRLQEWLVRGFIKPSIHKSTRIGDKNLFSPKDIFDLGRFIFLVEAGVTRKLASKMIYNEVTI